ncbi:MAG: hypothetical protein P9M06_03750 [Candidatus Saelkia tenebricola]|nr:hypothetical protein [Candidatus Saelkia tenebricola]
MSRIVTKKASGYIILFVVYTVFFIIMTFPLSLDFKNFFITNDVDAPSFVWNIYNFTDNVRGLKNPFVTDKIFYPQGANLIMHAYSPVYGILGLICGDNHVLSLNIVLFMSFILSSLGAYLLCNHYVNNSLLSFLAGFIFSYCPYKLMHLFGHYHLMLTATIPFFILVFIRTFKYSLDKDRLILSAKRNLIYLGLLFILTLLSDYYYSFYLGVFSLVYIMYFKFHIYRVNLFSIKNITWYLIVLFITNVLIKIFQHFNLSDKRGLFMSADIAGFFLPSPHSRFLSSNFIRNFYFNIVGEPMEKVLYLGCVLLASSVCYFLFKEYKKSSPDEKVVAFLIVCFFMFSMPVVSFAGKNLFALPSAIFHFIPFLNNYRAPTRWVVMIMLLLPVLSSLFIKRYILRRLSKNLHFYFITVLFLLVFIEYNQKTYSVESMQSVPKVYYELALRENGVLLEIPLGFRDGFGRVGTEETRQMFYQTIHHKKILSGMVSRFNKRKFEFFLNNPVILKLIMLELKQKVFLVLSDRDVSDFMRKFNIRYLLIPPEYRGSIIESFLKNIFAKYIVESADADGYLLITLRDEV